MRQSLIVGIFSSIRADKAFGIFWMLALAMAAKGNLWEVHEPYLGEEGICLILLDAFLIER